MNSITITGRRSPEDAAVSASSIHYLPFDVPPAVKGIRVRKRFEQGPDPTVRGMVDTGLFDPGGYGRHGCGAPGFRGWQGGTLQDLALTGDPATTSPQLLAGPIPPGRWYLGQWFIRSTPFGLDYEYTIDFSFTGLEPPETMPVISLYEPPIPDPRPGWYAGNLHAHTIHSDGSLTLAEVIAANKSAGYHFLACTDHNSARGHWEFAAAAQRYPDHLLIAGDELTSPSGHAGILGQTPGHWFDFRIEGGDGKLPGIIDEAHAQRALFVINHPFQTCTTCLWRYPDEECQHADAIEVWNGVWGEDDRRSVEWWDGMLKQGCRIHAVGGSDFHHSHDRLMPAARVYASSLSIPAIMDALRRGRLFLSETPQGPNLYLSTPEGALPGDIISRPAADEISVQVRICGGRGTTLRLIWQDGAAEFPITTDDATVSHCVPLRGPSRRPGHQGLLYVRAEIWSDGDRMLALTNPIYVKV